ncbi:H-2 class II histocompatibility antigen, E-S beta chain-like [Stegastes partitus]|uniref:H-2 class II histocompatibility antigen, E-S beta chain-like n=1 Tax=Stegastes partitus TaxID=144197 RepID=A0A3B5AQU2_9TELE|nr:PREDICTED: H-2 class II histocompatibility antigen, E-S beta chain-like [Stegastes partitus]
MASSSVSFWLLFITISTAGGFVYYTMDYCVFNSTELMGIEYIRSVYYNKLELTRFSSSLRRFVGYSNYGVRIAEQFNINLVTLNHMRSMKERYCQHNVHLYYNNILSKAVKPNVVLYSVAPPFGHHAAMLVCSVYNFYPKVISVNWLRDGKRVTSNITSTDVMEEGDWFYQVHSHLEYTPRSGEKISCVVEHPSLKEPLRTDWDPSMPGSESNKIAIGASGLVLGLVLFLAEFINYKRKPKDVLWSEPPTKAGSWTSTGL